MDLTADFFTLFQLPRAFRVRMEELDRHYHELQSQVHPDRFVQADERQRRLAMQRATLANEAYQTLKSPLRRASYLLKLAGCDLAAENNVAMHPAFLMTQMEWREAVQEARRGGDHHELERLQQHLALELQERSQTLAVLLDDQRDFPAAAEQVRQGLFLEKLRVELEDALAFLEDDSA